MSSNCPKGIRAVRRTRGIPRNGIAVERASETSMCLYGTGFPRAFFKRPLKTNIAGKTFPNLKSYLNSLSNKCPNQPFQYGPRCSALKIDLKPVKTKKNNNAPKLAELAQTLAKNNRERHQKVEDFFLTNDSATVAIEVPVYLYSNELSQKEQNGYGIELYELLSGHIDILQVRWNRIYILDYKPDVNRTDIGAADQLFLYALAISKRTKIPLNLFDCAFFNDQNYFQFSPLTFY